MSLYTQEIKTEPVPLRSYRDLDSIHLFGDLFKAEYRQIDEKQDGSKEKSIVKKQDVDRSIAETKGETVDFNGVQISMTDYINIGVLFAEKWRVQNDEAAANQPPADIGDMTKPVTP